MPDPDLEVVGELFSLIAGAPEQPAELLAHRAGLVPQFLRLRANGL